ncbi:hypothetical protein [Poseidonocella sp. HB161398]|uniref:hypothetical protein n=1 Tax=Poseidonocella sp. HB161398 TaxID=2320855 RepID=UPI001107BD8B|nr:hypothetical protein [Poseidonocella sp. HB161398]
MIGTDATGLLSAERFLRFGGLAAGPEFDTVTLWVDSAEIAEGGDSGGSGSALIDSLIGIPKEIDTLPGCLRYSIVFRDCVTYAWRDEGFAMSDEDEDEDQSSPIRRHDSSAFLDYIARATDALDALEAPLLHFSVSTLDAVLDVACPAPPEVSAEMIGPDDPGPKPGSARRR